MKIRCEEEDKRKSLSSVLILLLGCASVAVSTQCSKSAVIHAASCPVKQEACVAGK